MKVPEIPVCTLELLIKKEKKHDPNHPLKLNCQTKKNWKTFKEMCIS